MYLRVWPIHILELRAHIQHLHLDVISDEPYLFSPNPPTLPTFPLVVNSRSIV